MCIKRIAASVNFMISLFLGAKTQKYVAQKVITLMVGIVTLSLAVKYILQVVL